MSVLPTPARGRASTMVANVAVAIVVLVSALNLIGALTSLGEPTGTQSATSAILSAAVMVGVLVSYLVLVLRAPSTPRWLYLLVLTLIVLFAVGTSLGGDDGKALETNTTSVIGLLAVTAFMALPAVYMRLVTPKAKVKH